jgi:hypothetical protein
LRGRNRTGQQTISPAFVGWVGCSGCFEGCWGRLSLLASVVRACSAWRFFGSIDLVGNIVVVVAVVAAVAAAVVVGFVLSVVALAYIVFADGTVSDFSYPTIRLLIN